MLLKVVESGPRLVGFGTIFGETLVILGLAVVDMMHGFEMPIQVVSRGEPLLAL